MKSVSYSMGHRTGLPPTNCHLYHYAGNNPVRYVDPAGRDAKNTQKYYIAARLEKSMGTNHDCEIVVNIPRFNLDGVILNCCGLGR